VKLAAAVLALVLVMHARPAHADEPSDQKLVAVGALLAIPTWMLGTATHEGSHVVAAELVGADLLLYRPWPGRDPLTGVFQMGLTRVRGLRGDGHRFFFFMAPKITDALMLGGYVALYETSAYPDGAYGQLVLVVLATGFWVDFAKDTLAFSPHNDLVKSMSFAGAHSEWRRLPLRLGMAAASVGLGYVVWRGYDRMFALNDDPASPRARPLVLPVLTRVF
jgi:hypothetical protein